MKKILFFCLISALAGVAPLTAQEAEPYRIAFWINHELYTINSDGSNLNRFTFDPQQIVRIETAAWSPDGTRVLLALTHYEDGQAYLYLADGDGENLRPFIDDPVYLYADPRWSPDGSQIIFRDTADGEIHIDAINADGRNRRRIIEGYSDAPMPQWSPDGTQLAYLTGYIDYLNIWVLDLATGESREVIHELTSGLIAWSPAGDYIAFHHWDGSDDIYTVNIETGAIHQLGQDMLSSQEYFFNWSPDGARIAVTSNPSGSFQIYTMNPDGSDIRQLTDEATYATQYTYSPDGQWIAYWSERSGQGEVWIIHADGSKARQISMDEENRAFVAWSPDSAEIMLMRYGGDHRIRIANVASGDVRKLLTPPGDIRAAGWIGG